MVSGASVRKLKVGDLEDASMVARWYWQIGSFLHVDLSTRLLECPYNMVAVFPQSKQSKRVRQKMQFLL